MWRPGTATAGSRGKASESGSDRGARGGPTEADGNGPVADFLTPCPPALTSLRKNGFAPQRVLHEDPSGD